MARSYVYDHLVRTRFETGEAYQDARRHYTYAFKVRVAEKLENLAMLMSDSDVVVRNHVRPDTLSKARG